MQIDPASSLARPGHFLTLDGLRGVAAFEVILYHRRNVISPTIAFHGYLAVDFFFMLSGFVIAHAYWQRLTLGNLTFPKFVRLRAERLGPLVVLGVTLGSLISGWQALVGGDRETATGLALGWVPSLLLLPNPFLKSPFSADVPAWSLMFEVIGNLLFAIGALWLLRSRNLVAVIAATALGFLAVAVLHGTIEVGSEWPTLVYGLPRMLASFLIGVGLYRWFLAGSAPRIGLPFGALSTVLIILLLIPPEYHRMPVPVYEIGCVLLAFPAIILAGAQCEPGPRLAPVARLGAELSYPVYILHMPLIHAYEALSPLREHHMRLSFVVSVLVVTLASFLASRCYDRPLREWLAKRRRQKVGLSPMA